MDPWTLDQRLYAYDSFVRNNESIVTVQRDFRRHFNIHRNAGVPSRNTILRWVHNFRTTGSILKKPPPGPRPTARTPENIDRVREAFLRSPRRSVRRQSAALNMDRCTVRRILHEELHFHPYKIAVVQQLNERDFLQRVQFCREMLVMFEENQHFLLFMSDEAHFYLNGFVNKQNCRFWSETNPRQLHERPLHSPKVTVWCAVGKVGVVGPYFFEQNEAAVTVTGERYIDMINSFFVPELRNKEIDLENVYFQQDGATAHTSRATMAVLRSLFPGRIISRFGDIPWPARSPDLSSCDFFLWGYLKSRVYENKPRTLNELKNAIRHHISQIDPLLLQRVEDSYRLRLQQCIDENGHHLSDTIFRT
jgi:transposase